MSLLLTWNVSGQSSAIGSVSANIVTPISIGKALDLSFGNIAVNNDPGIVTLTPASNPSRTQSGGVTLPNNTGPVSAASFTVAGDAGNAFTITLPEANIIKRDGGL